LDLLTKLLAKKKDIQKLDQNQPLIQVIGSSNNPLEHEPSNEEG